MSVVFSTASPSKPFALAATSQPSESANVAVVRPEPLNAVTLIVYTEAGIVIVVSAVQFSNAELPIVSSVSGSVTFVSCAQSLNAELPIEMSAVPKLTVLSASNPSKALLPIAVALVSVTVACNP